MAAKCGSVRPRLLLAAAALVAAGCWGQPESKYARLLVPAAGRVTSGGRPLAGASLLFFPLDGTSVPAIGATDADGRYLAVTPLPNTAARRCRGMLPGRFRVAVRRLVMPDGRPVSGGMDETEALLQGATNSLPSRYESQDASPLTVDVPAGGSEDLDLVVDR